MALKAIFFTVKAFNNIQAAFLGGEGDDEDISKNQGFDDSKSHFRPNYDDFSVQKQWKGKDEF